MSPGRPRSSFAALTLACVVRVIAPTEGLDSGATRPLNHSCPAQLAHPVSHLTLSLRLFRQRGLRANYAPHARPERGRIPPRRST